RRLAEETVLGARTEVTRRAAPGHHAVGLHRRRVDDVGEQSGRTTAARARRLHDAVAEALEQELHAIALLGLRRVVRGPVLAVGDALLGDHGRTVGELDLGTDEDDRPDVLAPEAAILVVRTGARVLLGVHDVAAARV